MSVLRITQRTTCRYSRAVEQARIEYRVFPVSSKEQSVLRLDVSVEPAGVTLDEVDAWGNKYRSVAWAAAPVSGWTLSLDALVDVRRDNPYDFPAAAAWQAIPTDTASWPAKTQGFLRRPDDPWDNDPAVEAWARDTSSSTPWGFEKIMTIMRAIYDGFEFRRGYTDVKTSPGEILKIKRGVCQDFATLLIASARMLGLPARYVSGYVYDGPKSKRDGPAPAGHGWAEVFFPSIGWHGFDALNGILACHTHVLVARGRWYADAAPTIGRFKGVDVTQETVTEINVDKSDDSGRSLEDA